MMTFRWSWIFTVTLLVQLGNANFPSNDDPVVRLRRRETFLVDNSYIVSTSTTSMSTKNVGIIVACVVLGVGVAFGVIGWAYVSRSRRLRVPHVEEGMESPSSFDSTWKSKSNLRSQFSPDETKSYSFDRLRAAFGKRKKHEAILPVYNVPLPAGSVDSLERPPPAAQGHIPRYPSILERGNSQRSFSSDTSKKSPPSRRASPPPPLQGLPELTRTPSSSSTSSRVSGPRAQTRALKRPQPPLKAVLVPPPGRPLPGMSGAKTAVPKSPSKRRSWLSKHTFRHPFIPFRSPDISLKFPPGSPLGGYHPSRQHLEARFDMVTPRVSSPLTETSNTIPPASAKEIQRREHVIKRQPVPQLTLGEPSVRQVKIVEALQSAEIEGQMTPTGVRTALPQSSIKPLKTPKTPKTSKIVRILSPARVDSPVMPTTAYI